VADDAHEVKQNGRSGNGRSGGRSARVCTVYVSRKAPVLYSLDNRNAAGRDSCHATPVFALCAKQSMEAAVPVNHLGIYLM